MKEKYSYRKMKLALNITTQKNKLEKMLKVSYPTVNLWIEKYKADVNLIKSEVSEYKYEFNTLKDENKLMKSFIKSHYRINGKFIRTSEVMNTVNKWDIAETNKLRKKLKKSFN